MIKNSSEFRGPTADWLGACKPLCFSACLLISFQLMTNDDDDRKKERKKDSKESITDDSVRSFVLLEAKLAGRKI